MRFLKWSSLLLTVFTCIRSGIGVRRMHRVREPSVDMSLASEMASIATSVYKAEGAPELEFRSSRIDARIWQAQPVHETEWKLVPYATLFKGIRHTLLRFGLKKALLDVLAVFRKRNQCAVAFTGTKDSTLRNKYSDWITNFDCSVITPPRLKYEVKGGLWRELRKFRRQGNTVGNNEGNGGWARMIAYLLGDQCKDGFFSVGHSFGGMLASVFAAAMVADDFLLGENTTEFRQQWKGVMRERIMKGGLYTFGAGGISKSPMQFTDGNCFPGARFYVWKDDDNYDPVPLSTSVSVCNFLHPQVKAVRLEQDSNYIKTYWSAKVLPCCVNTSRMPSIEDTPSGDDSASGDVEPELARRSRRRRRRGGTGQRLDLTSSLAAPRWYEAAMYSRRRKSGHARSFTGVVSHATHTSKESWARGSDDSKHEASERFSEATDLISETRSKGAPESLLVGIDEDQIMREKLLMKHKPVSLPGDRPTVSGNGADDEGSEDVSLGNQKKRMKKHRKAKSVWGKGVAFIYDEYKKLRKGAQRKLHKHSLYASILKELRLLDESRNQYFSQRKPPPPSS